MANVETITYDKVGLTASDLFTVNGVVANTISYAGNQFTFNSRPAQTLTLFDLNARLTNFDSFNLGIALNFPGIAHGNLFDTTFEISRTSTEINYLFQGANAGQKVENLSWDINTKLCSVPLRNNAVTVSYAAFLYDAIMFDRFIKEINS